MQSTYDKIVENSLALLRGFTLDERASKLRDQSKAREVSAIVTILHFLHFTLNLVGNNNICIIWNGYEK